MAYLGRNQAKVDAVLEEAGKISEHCLGVTTDVLDEDGLNAGYEKVMNRVWSGRCPDQRGGRKYAWCDDWPG